jgi:DNA-directed RNA polymerase specialized sigma24 family protein
MPQLNSTDYQKLSVEELLATIAENADAKNVTFQKAFAEFKRRYAAYTYSVCKNTAAVKSICDRTEIETIVNNTLLCISVGAKTYKGLSTLSNESAKHSRVKGWLSAIARHEDFRYCKNDSNKDFLFENIDDYPNLSDTLIYEEIEEPPPTAENILFEKALNMLSKKDKDILETYLFLQDENGNLDSVYRMRLCHVWKVLPEHLRKVKLRAILKLKTIILKLSNPTDHGVKKEKRRRRPAIREETEGLLTIHRPHVPGNTGTG